MLIAPATANIIGKIASGIADDLVSILAMSADCPVALAPSMNTRMWKSPIVQRNMKTLVEHGYLAIDPEEGWLACRTVGAGRMADPDVILQAVTQKLQSTPPKNTSA
jgi:phosphopantothenoylcysteine decarboxylase/phosphopantothenate--cysteine ligase